MQGPHLQAMTAASVCARHYVNALYYLSHLILGTFILSMKYDTKPYSSSINSWERQDLNPAPSDAEFPAQDFVGHLKEFFFFF